MGLIQVTKQVEEHGYAVGQSLAGITKSITQALADGWQPGTDLPVILSTSVMELAKSIAHFGSLPDGAKAHPKEFKSALVLSCDDIADSVMDATVLKPAAAPVV